jgi:hypothetical protein
MYEQEPEEREKDRDEHFGYTQPSLLLSLPNKRLSFSGVHADV